MDGGNKMMRSRWWMTSYVCLMLAGTVAQADTPAKPVPPTDKTDKPKADPGGATAEVKVGTGVEKFEIVGEANTFPAGTTVWVWSRITNGSGAIKHVWKHDGKEVWTATLDVGSKKWATQSRRAISKAGSWEVDVQTADGASLGTVSFTVQ
jgi:hypothetical protein